MHLEHAKWSSAVWVQPSFLSDPNGSEAIAVIATSSTTWSVVMALANAVHVVDRWELRPETGDFKGALSALDRDFSRKGFVRLTDPREEERALRIVRLMMGASN